MDRLKLLIRLASVHEESEDILRSTLTVCAFRFKYL
jgi:hypothetical protein